MKVRIDGYVIDTDKIVAIHKDANSLNAEFTIVLSGQNNITIKRDYRSEVGHDPSAKKRDYKQFEHAWQAAEYGMDQDHKDIKQMYTRLMNLWGVEEDEKITDITV